MQNPLRKVLERLGLTKRQEESLEAKVIRWVAEKIAQGADVVVYPSRDEAPAIVEEILQLGASQDNAVVLTDEQRERLVDFLLDPRYSILQRAIAQVTLEGEKRQDDET